MMTEAQRLAKLQYLRGWRHRNRERRNAALRERRKNDPDFAKRCRENSAKWDAANPENVVSRQKAYHRRKYKGYFQRAEVEDILGMSPRHLFALCDREVLSRVQKIGNVYVFTPAQVLYLTVAVERCKFKTPNGHEHINHKELRRMLLEMWDKDPLSAIDCTNGGAQ